MGRSRDKLPSQRQLRVGEELRHALAGVLARGGFGDPLLADRNITVTEVRVSPDLKNATAFVTPLGGKDLAAVTGALNRAAGFVRAQVARAVTLRHMPRLSFQADGRFDRAMRMRRVLSSPRVRRDTGGPGDEDAADGKDLAGDGLAEDGRHGA